METDEIKYVDLPKVLLEQIDILQRKLDNINLLIDELTLRIQLLENKSWF